MNSTLIAERTNDIVYQNQRSPVTGVADGTEKNLIVVTAPAVNVVGDDMTTDVAFVMETTLSGLAPKFPAPAVAVEIIFAVTFVRLPETTVTLAEKIPAVLVTAPTVPVADVFI